VVMCELRKLLPRKLEHANIFKWRTLIGVEL
jgi:hypothetical protein